MRDLSDNIVACSQRARNYARRLARAEGMSVGRFKLIPGSDLDRLDAGE